MCVTTNQPDSKSNPNRNRITKQHAIINIQLNIVTCPTYPHKFTRDDVVAPSMRLSVVIVTTPPFNSVSLLLNVQPYNRPPPCWQLYRVAQQCKPLTPYQKLVLNPVTEMRFFVVLKCRSSSITLSIDIIRDLVCDVNSYARPAIPLALSRLSKLWILVLNHLLDGYLSKKFFDFHIFLLLSGFSIRSWSYALILLTLQLQRHWWRYKLDHA